MDGDGTIECVVAVRHPKPGEPDQTLRVVSPCGACRENIFDYDPGAEIILPLETGLRRVAVRALLPAPYQR